MAGPISTLPTGSKRLPWQGQSQLFSTREQVSGHQSGDARADHAHIGVRAGGRLRIAWRRNELLPGRRGLAIGRFHARIFTGNFRKESAPEKG
jgi:hypothetical protein